MAKEKPEAVNPAYAEWLDKACKWAKVNPDGVIVNRAPDGNVTFTDAAGVVTPIGIVAEFPS